MRQEFVLIGVDLPHDEIEAALRTALLTEAEFEGGEDVWNEMEDPLPEWSEEMVHGDHSEHEHGEAHASRA